MGLFSQNRACLHPGFLPHVPALLYFLLAIKEDSSGFCTKCMRRQCIWLTGGKAGHGGMVYKAWLSPASSMWRVQEPSGHSEKPPDSARPRPHKSISEGKSRVRIYNVNSNAAWFRLHTTGLHTINKATSSMVLTCFNFPESQLCTSCFCGILFLIGLVTVNPANSQDKTIESFKPKFLQHATK